MKAPSGCSTQATPAMLHFSERAPATVLVPTDAQTLLVYMFENSSACLAISGLPAGTEHLLPGEWLCIPVVPGTVLNLAAGGELKQHGFLHFTHRAVARRTHQCKCEIPVNIGPGWRLRSLGAPDGPQMLDVFMETGSVITLPDADAQVPAMGSAEIHVLSGELMYGGHLLCAGQQAVLPAGVSQILATNRSQYLLLQNI